MIDDVLLDAEERMTASVEHTRDELVTILSLIHISEPTRPAA